MCIRDRFEIYPSWAVTPDSTSVYEVKFTVFDYGIVTSSTTTTITDSSKSWISSAYVNLQVKIVSGTGIGQIRYITANTANQITVSTAWSINPDATSRFEVVGYKTFIETNIPWSTSTSYYGNTMVVIPIKGLNFVYFCRKNAQTDWWRYLLISP